MGLLTSIRDFVRDEIQATDTFAEVTILSEDRGVISSEVARGLATLNLFVVVMTPRTNNARSDTRQTYLDVDVTIQVGEVATLNQSGVRASDAAEHILALLQHKQQAGVFESLTPKNPPIAQLPIPPQLRSLTSLYQVNLTTSGGFVRTPAISKVAEPVITATNPAAITIACSTPGANVFYTTNESTPNPHNGTLYTGAFAATSGATVRARAGRWGMLASELARATVA